MAKKSRDTETAQEEMIRRLGDFIEFATATKKFQDLGFYEKLLEYVSTHSVEDLKPKKHKECSNKVNSSCPLHNLFCAYPKCEEDD